MTTDNRRKEEQSKAKTEELGRNPTQLLKGAKVDETERNISHLPSNQGNAYIPRIEGVVSDWNMQAACIAVKRNKGGAPGMGSH
jgi:hypothetical protein